MGKRILLCLMILSMIFLFVFCDPATEEPPVKIVYDKTPPTLVSVSTEYVEGGEGNGEVKIQIAAVDDLTYVLSINCTIGSPTKTALTDSYDYTDKRTVNLIKQGNIWVSTYDLSKFSENGIWTIDNIQIADRGNKTRVYYLDPSPDNPLYAGKYYERFSINPSNPSDFNAVTFDRQNTFLTNTLEITAPDLDLPPSPADLNISIDFENDEPEYIQNVEVELISPKIRNNEKGLVIIKNLAWNGSDRWSAPITFYSYNQSGSWLIRKITITDTDPAPKIITYYTNNYSGTASQYEYVINDSGAVYTTGFNKKSINITTGASDAVNPVLNSLITSHTVVNPSSGDVTVNITANFTEADSGLYSVRVNIICNLNEDDIKTNTVIISGPSPCIVPFTFISSDTTGSWTLTSIILTDNAGNYREYLTDSDHTVYYYDDSLDGSASDTNTSINKISITKI